MDQWGNYLILEIAIGSEIVKMSFYFFRGEFSYSKLKDKRDNRPGTFIIRECESSYDTYFIDVCGHDSKPRTYRIKKTGPEEYYFSATGKVYKSLRQITTSHRDSSEPVYLQECLRASEYGTILTGSR